ncbi:hypothetical protein B0T17DRAFT_304448 [Bombardia bombarda]|uniref:U6 small nuclear RNA (adenine-(43)-N(6))-methyltransferase n=1 Tax=Bombardia bombarda TaxID=252184 RepID=A0AA39WUB8_9PEZI|nr:hypothetical protein B0T17DRAFT_304448 [Bombardia bombarda]
MMQLTKTLLKQHFDLKVELPHDRLCPPVPNRHNYILWLKDLMDTTSYAPPGRKLCGLDVGTGASCIYPLLGTAQRPWCFVATDIDAKSLSYAQKNIELNQLSDRIRLIKRESPSDPLVPLDDIGVESIDFVMMNPPFYTSEDEMLSSAKKKERPPHSACTGAPVEMVCDGGEVAYVGRMVRESLVLRERVQWYTTMLGKVTSLDALVEQLRENGIDNYAVTEFVQGNKTRRWALGWSFGAMRPEEQVARGMTPAPYRKILPPVVSMELLKLGPDKLLVEPVMKKINELVGKLELISWTWEGSAQRGVGRARENVWSRAWRRKKAKEKTEGKTSATFSAPNCHDKVVKEEQCRFGFVIEITIKQWGSKVLLRWVEGHDQALFESFGGFLQRELKECAV